MPSTNRFAVAARQIKARKMADVLTLQHTDAATAAALPESHRLIVAELAGCLKPSATTWALVVELVAADAAFMARAAHPAVMDPIWDRVA